MFITDFNNSELIKYTKGLFGPYKTRVSPSGYRYSKRQNAIDFGNFNSFTKLHMIKFNKLSESNIDYNKNETPLYKFIDSAYLVNTEMREKENLETKSKYIIRKRRSIIEWYKIVKLLKYIKSDKNKWVLSLDDKITAVLREVIYEGFSYSEIDKSFTYIEAELNFIPSKRKYNIKNKLINTDISIPLQGIPKAMMTDYNIQITSTNLSSKKKSVITIRLDFVIIKFKGSLNQISGNIITYGHIKEYIAKYIEEEICDYKDNESDKININNDYKLIYQEIIQSYPRILVSIMDNSMIKKILIKIITMENNKEIELDYKMLAEMYCLPLSLFNNSNKHWLGMKIIEAYKKKLLE